MSRDIDEILMPGGRPLGTRARRRGATDQIRDVPGGVADAEAMFQELTAGGKDITPPGHQGKMVELPNGRGVIGYRPASGGGHPTIDVKAVDSAGRGIPIKKIKFVS